MFKRKFRHFFDLSTDTKDHYDCDGCNWEGIDVPKGERELAIEAYSRHVCRHYIHP